MEEKKPEFVVSDRRRFAPEGELRPDAVDAEVEEDKPTAPAQSRPAAGGPPKAKPEAEKPEMPPPPTDAEQRAQTEAYQASGKKLEELVNQSGARREHLQEMTFERLVESFYMTALLQLGAVRQEGQPAEVDLLGARQTIDSLTILQEKTKGNLNDREQTLLQNVLFELRMAWVEITNALAAAPAKTAAGPQRK